MIKIKIEIKKLLLKYKEEQHGELFHILHAAQSGLLQDSGVAPGPLSNLGGIYHKRLSVRSVWHCVAAASWVWSFSVSQPVNDRPGPPALQPCASITQRRARRSGLAERVAR